MMSTSSDVTWGQWSLGDLAEVARDAADLLGRSEDVEALIIEKPYEVEAPQVRITVRDEGGTLRLRDALKRCGREAQFVGFPTIREWTVEVAEMVLTVKAES